MSVRDWRSVAHGGRWTVEMARCVMEAHRASGLSLKAFCEAEGVKYERVRRWGERLQRQPAKTAGFVALQVVDEVPAAPAGTLEIRVGAYTLRTEGDVSEAQMARALRAMSEAGAC